MSGDGYEIARRRLVEQLAARGIRDRRVLAALGAIPRHEFVRPELRHKAYDDCALPIAADQTISQPYVVALMVEAALIGPDSSVLEVGTGSGYATAVIARLARVVYTIERIGALARDARERLVRLGCTNVAFRTGDGNRGWPEHAPFDRAVVAAAAAEPPAALLTQLALRGRLVMPVGDGPAQALYVFTRARRGVRPERIASCQFVPFKTGTVP